MMRSKARWTRLVAVVPLTAGLLLAGCGDDDSAGPEAGVTVDDLEELERRVGALEEGLGAEDEGLGEDEESDSLVGQTVTVSGEVTRMLGRNAFILSGEEEEQDDELGEFGSQLGEGVLVVSANVPSMSEGNVVRVVGTVARFVIADVEEDLGIDLDDELFVEYEDQAALIARSIDTTIPTEDE